MNKPIGNTGLDVYLGVDLVGRLWLDDKRRFVFQYDSSWIAKKNAVPLSLGLPLQPDIYADDFSRPFFSNLLPEAELILLRHIINYDQISILIRYKAI